MTNSLLLSLALYLALIGAAGCSRDSRDAAATTSPASAAQAAPAVQKEKAEDRAGQAALEGLKALVAEAGPKETEKENALPAGFVPDGECAETPGESDSAADPAAVVPLVEGLTLSQMWIPTATGYEHECLVQITKIDAREISVTRSCPVLADRHMQVDHRRICRSDFANARLFAPVTSEHTPDVMGGTTFFSLSRASFRELRDTGETSHRYVHYKSGEMRRNAAGTLRRERPSAMRSPGPA